MDFTTTIEIAQVNTYSWHPNSRGPQLYKLYAADGSDPKFNPDPKRGIDPSTCGWKLIALVSTLPDSGDGGGQYASSVTDVGKYRYLLFDCYVTELYDNWGNTFYSEIDVNHVKSVNNPRHPRLISYARIASSCRNVSPISSNPSNKQYR